MTASLEQYLRIRTAAGIGLAAQTLATAGLLLGGTINQSSAMTAAGLLAGAGVLIWAVLLLVYWQHVAERQEDLEAEDLRRQRIGSGIFEGEDVSLRLARKRLANIMKYLLPAMTLVVAAYYLAMAALCWMVLFKVSPDTELPLPRNPLAMAGLCGFGAAFVLFVISRYAGGLAKLDYASLMRAGSGHMFLTSLAALACCVVLVLVDSKAPRPEQITARVFPWLLVILGLEALLNFVLNLYRPRRPDDLPRAGFESRLSNLLAEPTGIAGSIAQSLNYQFGFEISKTWFYLLIQRSLGVLITFQVVTLLSLTCLTVIPASSVALVETLGRLEGLHRASNGQLTSSYLLNAGLHLKLCWPIQTVLPVNLGEVRSLSLGLTSGTVSAEDEKRARDLQTILWSDEVHGASPELDLLVARGTEEEISRSISPKPPQLPTASRPLTPAPPADAVAPTSGPNRALAAQSVPVSIVRTRVEILYRVTDPVAFTYYYAEPEKVLLAIADRELTRYLASTSLQQVLGGDRDAAARGLLQRINHALGAVPLAGRAAGTEVLPNPLGVEVFYVGFQDIHPPKDLVTDFESVISAQHEAQATIQVASSIANRTLAEVAGTREAADAVFALINRYTQVQSQGLSNELTKLAVEIESLVETVGGRAASTLSQARAERWETVMTQRGKAEGYAAALGAYRAAPKLFQMDQINQVLIRELGERRKYFQAFDSPVVKLWVDLQDPPAAGLLAPVEPGK